MAALLGGLGAGGCPPGFLLLKFVQAMPGIRIEMDLHGFVWIFIHLYALPWHMVYMSAGMLLFGLNFLGFADPPHLFESFNCFVDLCVNYVQLDWFSLIYKVYVNSSWERGGSSFSFGWVPLHTPPSLVRGNSIQFCAWVS